MDQAQPEQIEKVDDTPQPLRVQKQRKEPGVDNASRQSVMASEPAKDFPQVYRHYLSWGANNFNQNNQIQTSVPNASSTASSSPPSDETLELSMPKHRLVASHRKQASSTTSPGDASGGDECPTVKKNDRYLMNRTNINKDKRPSRAATTGFIPDKEILGSFNDETSSSNAPTPLTPRNRLRAVTMDVPHEATEFEALGQYPDHSMARSNSHKRKLLSRRSKRVSSRNSAITGTDRTTHISSEETATSKELPNQSPSVGLNENSKSTSPQSPEKEAQPSNHLAPFPQPPKSRFPSATAFPSQGLEHLRIELRGGPLMAEHVAVPSAEISAVAETDRIDSEGGESIFVAIEIRGVLNLPSHYSESRLSGLDVVIIIDNS